MRTNYWWLKPSSLTLYFILPLYALISFRLMSMDYTLSGQVPYKDGLIYFYGGIILLTFVLGAISGELVGKSSVGRIENIQYSSKRVELALKVLGGLSIVAYLIWFGPILLNFPLVKQILTATPGVNYYVRNNYSTISGLTTLTQFGVVFVSAYMVYKPNIGTYPKVLKYLFYMVIFLTLFRVLAWSERLALIEIALPIFIALFSYNSKVKLPRLLINLMPFLGVALMIIFFISFEYGRSWLAYYSDIYDSLIVFGIDRFLEYYLIAINNGAGMMSELDWPTWQPDQMLKFLFEFPIIGGFFSSFITLGGQSSQYLYLYGDAEFNNTSGIFLILFEFGWIGLIVTFIIGGIIGWLFGLSRYSLLARTLYGCVFIGVLEILRVGYFSEGRFIAVLIGFFLFFILIKGKKYVAN